jgi:hypothetical protein
MNKESENSLIGADLCKLSLLLNNHGLCSDTSPLESAGQACMGLPESSNWSYTVNKIAFTATEIGRLATDAEDISVSLTMGITGKKTISEQVENPLDDLSFNIEIEAIRPNSVKNHFDTLYAAWHLDRHISHPGDGENQFSHPLYHFAFGGENMEGKGYDFYGNTIILNSPRLIYPPMDAILGIDFILQNYIHRDFIQELIRDPEYKTIVRRSQERLWKPFYMSLYSHWDPRVCNTEETFTPIKLFPLFS